MYVCWEKKGKIMDVKKRLRWIFKGSRIRKRLIINGVIALMVGILVGDGIGRARENKKSEQKVSQAVAKAQAKSDEKLRETEKQLYHLKEQLNQNEKEFPWNLVLVNGACPMEEGYVPELKELEAGLSVDSRIYEAAKKMLTDAKKAGLHVKICSAYRSVERQQQVFGSSMKERVNEGMSYWDAYEETVLNVALPGTSEHALGLALDLVSNEYTELDERQENTAEAKWLKDNCHKYGFILRYPPEKTNITGIIYEPWHYRYVGVEDATEIMKLGVTLEEYLQDYY